MNHETHPFRHARGTYAAFTTGRDKWFYGVLLHNIAWLPEDDCGTFFLEDGHVETYNIKVVDAATLRLQKGDYSISQYKRGLDAGGLKFRRLGVNLGRTRAKIRMGRNMPLLFCKPSPTVLTVRRIPFNSQSPRNHHARLFAIKKVHALQPR